MSNLDAGEIERLREYDIAHVIHPQFNRADHEGAVMFASGEGAVLTDVEAGVIDALSSLWNVAVGHGRRELADAAAEQMSQLAFSNSYTGYANVPSVRLTEKLLALAPSNMSGVFYANSGSEANEMAIKAARYFWFVSGQPRKTKIISRQEAYHGGTMAATAVTGIAPFHKGFGPEPAEFVQVPTCYRYRCQWCVEKPPARSSAPTTSTRRSSARGPILSPPSSPSRCTARAASSRPIPATGRACARSAIAATYCSSRTK